jgi:hypothetical protein
MSHSTSETGHTINVANFDTLITTCIEFGPTYNPVKSIIKIENLKIKFDKSDASLTLVNKTNEALNKAINQRFLVFSGIESLSTQVTNAYAVSEGVEQKDIDDLRAIHKKIQGPKSKKEKPIDASSSPKAISTSQQSFDNKAGFFREMIQFLEAKPNYNPNEDHLKVNTLKELYNKMIEANKLVDKANKNSSDARIARNHELYDPEIGLVDIAKEVKKYFKTIFKTNSPEFKQINSIPFKVIK